MKIGTGASPGIAFGKALVIKNEELVIEKKSIENIEDEKKRFERAVQESKAQLLNIKEKASKELDEGKSAIFDAHIMVLEDPELISSTLSKVESEGINAEYAFKEVIEQFIAIFEAMDNEYMRERVSDLKDVSGRVFRNLMGKKVIDLSVLDEEVILVAEDLTPSETVTMDKQKVLGFLTNIGGRTSHTAIMARTLEIPAVVGLKDITEVLKEGDIVAFNGETGEVVINPSEEEINHYKELKDKYDREKKELENLKGQESITLDGRKVELAGNIGTPNDIEGLLKNDAEGVGLYRTEFIYMDRDSLPTEDEQFEAYKKVLEAMSPKPVVIRTLDIGGDKEVSYLNIDKEMNPFLGYRAIRLCLEQRDIFETQLRALLRASIYGNLKIMFPMISSLEELLEAKKVLEKVKKDLDNEGIKYASNIEVGMMIEVPSAAIISDILAKHVDFFSIGTNDLIQYTTAVDRMNQKIRHLYNPFNPAVIRLIKMVIDNGHKEGIWVGMCGEMAGDKKMIPILLGLGLDEFSMSPISILPARKLIKSLSSEEMKKFADKILSMSTAEEIEKYIENYFK
ncbi:phosphotransferase system, enzyme I, PtsI [Caminicella sporogenes DSM 14501]|uniref:Phosphoenolpyruvate-protein phosphotransferase n=1 Tax=Caminicella sporogenes DSM 14501 TaxID=1121266 RepID=A0A1M6QA25_9FIRM|nr:phosphoenolpyruvate--protein phosphotransferase [Caminicella sporogenes]RKD23635.1 phosphoenolpyruvate--protein phosphotransferase [Caminicella sporogenes]SHK17041.1 phosphotransferase system, enzyme I, PtsI [Caminicella sporogenes DSM 14501]